MANVVHAAGRLDDGGSPCYIYINSLCSCPINIVSRPLLVDCSVRVYTTKMRYLHSSLSRGELVVCHSEETSEDDDRQPGI